MLDPATPMLLAAQLLQAAADQNDARAKTLLATMFDPTSGSSLAPPTTANARMAAQYYRLAEAQGGGHRPNSDGCASGWDKAEVWLG